MPLLRWLHTRDRDLAALRRAVRAAIIMPTLFAFGAKVLDNPDIATFAAFGSFAMLLLVDFGGPRADRVLSHTALALVGAVFVVGGTLASRNPWLAAAAMGVVGFAVLFAGVVSSVLAGASTSLLLAFILPVSVQAPASAIPDRLAGWGMASVVAVLASAFLWPAPARDPLRGQAVEVCRALAARLRSDVAKQLDPAQQPTDEGADEAMSRVSEAVTALRRTYLSTPYRPTGLTTATRTVIRLVDELMWLQAIAAESAHSDIGSRVDRAARSVRSAAARVLDEGAELLEETSGAPDAFRDSLAELDAALGRMEHYATKELPVLALPPTLRSPAAARSDDGSATSSDDGSHTAAPTDPGFPEFVTSLEPSFRAQELAFAVSLVGQTIDRTAAAERRSWVERALGRQPEGVTPTLAAVQIRAAAHIEPHSVWLHNSLRGAVGLALAVLVSELSRVDHSSG